MAQPAKIRWGVLFAVWTGIGLVLLAQVYATIDLSGKTEWETRMNHYGAIYLQMLRAWLWCLLTPVVFELRRRIPVRGRWLAVGVLLHFAFASAFIVWIIQVRFWIWSIAVGMGHMLMSFEELVGALRARTMIDALLYLGLLGAGYTLDLNREKAAALAREKDLQLRLTAQELQQEQLRSELVQAEMKALKQQLHPHFLFNALNAVSGLVRQGAINRAVDALSRVSALLRAFIGSTGRAEVTLEEEIGYCRTYLDIEKMRFDEKLSYEFEIAPDCLFAEVPTLLLQPTVENAIKHGIACRRNPGWVRISARARGNRLLLEVTNDPAEMAKGQATPASHGIGLATTRQRLEKAYGSAYRLDCELNTPRGTVVKIELPLRIAEFAVPVRA